MEKLDEGGFNRIFLITMHDGFRMIARIPYPFSHAGTGVAADRSVPDMLLLCVRPLRVLPLRFRLYDNLDLVPESSMK